MKKNIAILAFLMTLINPVIAQDTIHVRHIDTMARYYIPVWCNNFEYNSTLDAYRGWVNFQGESFSFAKEEAFRMYTDDTLQVYGIAACLTTIWQLDSSWLEYDLRYGIDTSRKCLYGYLRLYEAETDSLRHVGEELLVYLLTTPVSYYLDLGLYQQPILPMYERFFSAPVTVADSFYVGRRYRTDCMDGNEMHLATLSSGTIVPDYVIAFYRDYVNSSGDTVRGWQWTHWPDWGLFYFIFPIIAPPDTTVNPGGSIDTLATDTLVVHPGNSLVLAPGDTLVLGGDTLVVTGDTLVVHLGDTILLGGHSFVVNPGDTLVVGSGDTIFVNPDGSITVSPGSTIVILGGTGGDNPGGDDPVVGLRQADMVYRYTAVSPNPATGRATVTSSFGLTQIEAFDEQGRLVQTLPATGLKATLDVSSWPRGTYLLRIHTPLGTATKKLVISR